MRDLPIKCGGCAVVAPFKIPSDSGLKSRLFRHGRFNGEIFQHFGHTEQFKVYEVENGKIVKAEVADSNGCGHGCGNNCH